MVGVERPKPRMRACHSSNDGGRFDGVLKQVRSYIRFAGHVNCFVEICYSNC